MRYNYFSGKRAAKTTELENMTMAKKSLKVSESPTGITKSREIFDALAKGECGLLDACNLIWPLYQDGSFKDIPGVEKVDDWAKMLGRSTKTIRNYAKAGELIEYHNLDLVAQCGVSKVFALFPLFTRDNRKQYSKDIMRIWQAVVDSLTQNMLGTAPTLTDSEVEEMVFNTLPLSDDVRAGDEGEEVEAGPGVEQWYADLLAVAANHRADGPEAVRAAIDAYWASIETFKATA